MFFLQRALYFHCNQCGACCRDFLIPLSHKDVQRLLAAYPEQPPEALFLLRPADPSDVEALLFGGEWFHLLLQRGEDACLFLLEDGRCGTYESRPRACRTFPFDLDKLGFLQILPDAEPVYQARCDREKPQHRVSGHEIKLARQQSRLGAAEFTRYRDLVEKWNRWAHTQAPQDQTLGGFIEMIRAWGELSK